MRARVLIVALLALFSAYDNCAAAEPRPRTVLVVMQSHGSGPFFGQIFSSLRATLNSRSTEPATFLRENVEVRWSGSPEFDETLAPHLKAKYGDTPLDLIVAVGAASLCYAITTRDALWPGVPIVFAMVDEPTFRKIPAASNVTGSFMNLTLADMVRASRAMVPDLRRLAIVGDTLKEQPVFHFLEHEIPAAIKGLELIDLTGLPMIELRARISELPNDAAILYTAIYSDGRGMRLGPGEAFSLVAEAANRPIVVAAENLVGRGTGGFVLAPSAIGERAGALALRLFAGEPAAAIPASYEDVIRPVFDWNQLQRWHVDPNRLPPGSEIRNRPVTFWDQYAWHMSGIAAAFLTLTALVFSLLHERRIRFVAEFAAGERMSELAHINRHATAGEMSAAIAHELNQPLGAILNNAEAATILLESGSPDINELKAILSDIRRDDERASEIIKRLRALVSKKVVDFQPIDLNSAAREALSIAQMQAHSSDITLHWVLSPNDLPVAGDAIQLQQVILNLAINAIEATNERKDAPRDIVARTANVENNTVEFSISDFGPGIPADKFKHLFEPFFTTKSNGMGMGLSLARTIVEAHGGKLWAENGVTGGAVFRFRLPRS